MKETVTSDKLKSLFNTQAPMYMQIYLYLLKMDGVRTILCMLNISKVMFKVQSVLKELKYVKHDV